MERHTDCRCGARFHFPVLHSSVLRAFWTLCYLGFTPSLVGWRKDIHYGAQVTGPFSLSPLSLWWQTLQRRGHSQVSLTSTQTSTNWRNRWHTTWHNFFFLLPFHWYFTSTTNIPGIPSSSLAVINVPDSYLSWQVSPSHFRNGALS